jgi:hypothetical protein
MKTEHQEFILTIKDSSTLAYTLSLTADLAPSMEYKPGFYLSEHDGLSAIELFGAVEHLFPDDVKAENNGRDQAWISHWDREKLAEYAGNTYRVRSTITIDEDGDCIDQTFELLA